MHRCFLLKRTQGNIISMIYKGDHYRYIVRTEENEEDYVLSCKCEEG